MIEIELTWDEVEAAANDGVKRLVDSLSGRCGTTLQNNQPMDRLWRDNILGSLGERAVSKFLGLPMTGASVNYPSADVGNVEVRTAGFHLASLIVKPNDHDGRAFVLVCVASYSFQASFY